MPILDLYWIVISLNRTLVYDFVLALVTVVVSRSVPSLDRGMYGLLVRSYRELDAPLRAGVADVAFR